MRRNKNKLGSILFGIFFWFFYRLNWVSILEILILFRNDRVLTSRRRLKTLISNSTSMRLQKKTCFSRRGTDSIPIAVSSTAESPPPPKKKEWSKHFFPFSPGDIKVINYLWKRFGRRERINHCISYSIAAHSST